MVQGSGRHNRVRFEQAHAQVWLIELGLEEDRWPCLRRTPSQVHVLVRDGAARRLAPRFFKQTKLVTITADPARGVRGIADA